MKKILFIIFILLLGLNTPAFSQDTSTINGSSHLNKGEYDSLEVNGSLTFTDLDIKDSIVINGSIQGKNLKCKTMESNGSVDINGLKAQSVESNGSFSGENIDIMGELEVNGRLEIKNGKLHNIKIASTSSTIMDTKVNGNIRIEKATGGWKFFGFKSNESSPQILELKGNSIVIGDVIFEKEGEVHLFDIAKVEGKVINAKVIQKK